MSCERFVLERAGLFERGREGGSSTGLGQENMAKRAGRAAGLAKLAKVFAIALTLIGGLSAAPRPASASVSADFVRTLGTQALEVIRSNATLAEKVAYFRQMLFEDFDLRGMSRFVLGRYWRVASPAEQNEFRSLFADHLIHTFGQRLAQSGGGSFIVTGSRADTDGAIVASRIVAAQGPAIAVEWRLGVSDGLYKIEDVAIDGVSMALAQRSEFAEIIERDGGRLETLLATLR